ncbi:nitrate/nitrite transporter NrtS [Vibrio profundi]|uniref:nitrate/nitrite transporter NrtS n=1 Tax=Vibrio profundi TaxID=1774960 RepID=UPI003736E33A
MNKTLIKRAVIIAMIVGSILNVINQFDAIFGAEPIEWLKVTLTYCVPFIVSLVSSYITIKEMNKEKEPN